MGLDSGSDATHQFVTSANGELAGGAWHAISVNWSVITSIPTVRFDGAALSSPTERVGSGNINVPTQDYKINNNAGNTKPADIRIAEARYRHDNRLTDAWHDLEWDCFSNPGSIAAAEALITV